MTKDIGTTSPGMTAEPTGLLGLAVGLMLIGLVMVASTTASIDRSLFDGSIWRTSLGRQLIFVGAGIVLMFVSLHASRLVFRSPRALRFLVIAGAVITFFGLLAVLIPGLADPHRGSSRWLRVGFGGFSFAVQPSEPAKLALVGLLAWLLTRESVNVASFWASFVPAAVVIGLFVALVGSQDFGTSALLGVVGMGMLMVSGCRWRYLLGMIAIGMGGMYGLLRAATYRMDRLAAFRDIWADPQGDGYQPIQSLTAIASGSWLGSGLGGGIQKYGYLPESHTDFIFSAICEEMGAVGGFLVIALYITILYIGLRTVWRARTRFERLLAFGLTATIATQAAMNIAVVTVLAPTTGISLPFVSAGGSGLLTFCVLVGVLGAVASRGVAVAESSAKAEAIGSSDLAGAGAW